MHLPTTNLLFAMPGGTELILIIAIVLLMFGGKKIPELMRGIGKGMKEFKEAKDQVGSEIDKGMNETPVRKDDRTIPVKA